MAKKSTETHSSAEESATAQEASLSSEIVVEARELVETAQEAGETLADAIRDGVSDARKAAAGFFPAVGGMIHKSVYNGFYYASYGVVFSALVVGRLIPSNNAMGEGVRDGASAARKDFETREEHTAADDALTPA